MENHVSTSIHTEVLKSRTVKELYHNKNNLIRRDLLRSFGPAMAHNRASQTKQTRVLSSLVLKLQGKKSEGLPVGSGLFITLWLFTELQWKNMGH